MTFAVVLWKAARSVRRVEIRYRTGGEEIRFADDFKLIYGLEYDKWLGK